MAKVKKQLSADQRKSGRAQVIATIRRAGQIARIDIAQATGVSPATVTSITSELIATGLIEETARASENGDNKRGRPRVDLQLRPDALLVAGIKIANNSASVAFIDFIGETVGEFDRKLPEPRMSAGALCLFIDETVTQALDANGIPRDRLDGLGVGVAGLIDAPRGFVYWSPSLTERNFDLRTALQDRMSLPVFIDNDANLVTKAEQLFGKGREVSNYLVVTIENGVGMGVVLNDKIYRGTRGCGAEFGHTKVQLGGALCRCGQRGCLEAYVGDYALLREARIAGTVSDDASFDEQLEQLFTAAKAGDPTANSIFERAGDMFAIGLANLINVFDPELIILSGERMKFDFLYADAVLEEMKKSVVQVDAPMPDVHIHKWGDFMWAKGAAAFAMEGVTELAISQITADAD